MQQFDLSPLARFPRATAASRSLLGVAVVAVYAWLAVTAGPGNGVEQARQPQYVTLPQVVIVAQREAPAQATVASAAVTRVNLQR